MNSSKFNKIVLIFSFIAAFAGVILRLNFKLRIAGDVFLLISTVLWFYIFYKFILWFITEKK